MGLTKISFIVTLIFICGEICSTLSSKTYPVFNYTALTFSGLSVIKHDGKFYAVTVPTRQQVKLHSSSDLNTWTEAGDIFSGEGGPPWMLKLGFNNVALVQGNERFLLYFEERGGCIRVASSSTLTGPFQLHFQPILCSNFQEGPPRYPTVLNDNGTLILYFGQRDRLGGVILANDGLSIATEYAVGKNSPMLDCEKFNFWRPKNKVHQTVLYNPPCSTTITTILTPQGYKEHRILKAHVFKRSLMYYIIYKADDCNDWLLVARSSHPLGPFEKRGNVGLVKHTLTTWQPDFPAGLEDNEGNYVLFYLASEQCNDYQHHMFALQLEWQPDGWPKHS